MYRFLLTRRWAGYLAIAVAFAVACVLLGNWQLHRYEQRVARNGLVTSNYDRSPVGLDDALPSAGTGLDVAATWTPVRLEGSYVPDGTVLLRNRPLDGTAGYHVLVPFLVDDGRVVLVDRGWLTTGEDGGTPDTVPAAPSGRVVAVVRLRPAEEASDRDAPAGQTYRIDPAALADGLASAAGRPVAAVETSAYGELATEDPAPAVVPTLLPRPELDDGPHLSYAFQWVVFALMALVGFVVVARRTAHEDEPEEPAEDGTDVRSPPHRPRRRGPRGPSDEDLEDADLDAAERR